MKFEYRLRTIVEIFSKSTLTIWSKNKGKGEKKVGEKVKILVPKTFKIGLLALGYSIPTRYGPLASCQFTSNFSQF